MEDQAQAHIDQTEAQTGGEVAGTPAPKHHSVLGTMLRWARDLLLSVVLAIVVILFLYQPVKVEGTSMEPTLDNNERIFINKFIYRFHLGEIEHGDMVVFWFPYDSEWQAAGRELRSGRVPRHGFDGLDEGAAGRILRAGRPSQLVERQSLMGHGSAAVHLREGCVCVLAAG
jgi:hypothetical protein